ncbi:sodium-coupled monocarboxylate transporter 2-like isoform X2 [Macrobrachium nipponense]|uniref:sodium-coupled monocarboxylate transporter 2-like isoform X2 n=1 Tax=Macrobrachium nipponense TaxID=159736 RepID=UPI0030C7C242
MYGLPAEMYFFGTQLSLSILGIVYGSLILHQLILPVLYPLKIASISRYIVLRYGSKTLKNLGSLTLMISALIYMSIVLYSPSLALSAVTGLSPNLSVAIIGLSCTFYITIGGVKAVVYTDVLQSFLMVLGLVLTFVFCLMDLDGIGDVFYKAGKGGRLEFFNMDPDPLVRHTFWSVQMHGMVVVVLNVGLSQPGHQRFSSVPTLDLAKRACTIFCLGVCATWVLVYFSGIVAYAAYSTCDPLTRGAILKPDQIMPFLVMEKLSHLPGVVGLFISAVYASVFSTMSSFGNSLASLLWEDFFLNWTIFKEISEAKAVRIVKLLSLLSGLLATGLGMLVGHLGSIANVAATFTHAMAGPMCGLFLGGMCLPWLNLKGAYAGFISSAIFAVWLVVGKFVNGLGNPKKLPLSTDGCLENVVNFSNVTLNLTSSLSSDPLPGANAIYSVVGDDVTTAVPTFAGEEEERGFYHLSYCYNGIVGMLIFFVVGSIASFFTGPLNPHEIDDRLISPRCLKFSKWVHNAFKHSDLRDTTGKTAIPDSKVEAIIHKEETAKQVEPAAYTEIHL